MSVVTATLFSDGRQIGQQLELVSIDVRREVNRIASASLVLLDGSAAQRALPLSDCLNSTRSDSPARMRSSGSSSDSDCIRILYSR